MGQKRNSDIREQLGIFSINDKLTKYKINWRDHIRRRDLSLIAYDDDDVSWKVT